MASAGAARLSCFDPLSVFCEVSGLSHTEILKLLEDMAFSKQIR